MDRGAISQWDIVRLTDRQTLVVVIQSDLVGGVSSRLVAPLIPDSARPKGLDVRLFPTVLAGDTPLVADMLDVASIGVGEMRDRIASAESARDGIERALDMILAGV